MTRPEVKSIQLPAVDVHPNWIVNSAAFLLLFSEESFHLGGGYLSFFQTPGRGHPDGAEPSGELWTSRSLTDQTSDPHHPPLC